VRTGTPLALAAVLLAAALPLGATRQAGARIAVVTVAAGPERATGVLRGAEVVTVAHVLDGGDPTAAGRPAHVIGVDRTRDLAVLRVPGLHARSAPAVGGVAILVRRAGRTVAVPTRVRRRITVTVTPASGGVARTREALELEAAIEPGDSGAPVVAPGRLLGIVFARSERRARTAYAVRAPD
jgi:S1-C subfamily serine protease